jgi:hypothetical protein
MPPLLESTSSRVTLPRHVTLASHWTKMSLLPPLHLSVTLCRVASPLEQKLKYWIYNTATGYPSPDRPTPTIYRYKKIILTLDIPPITQPHHYFAFSLVRAPRHRSSTRRRRSLSLPPHAHHPSIQWHPQLWSSRLSFTYWTNFQYVNSVKRYF